MGLLGNLRRKPQPLQDQPSVTETPLRILANRYLRKATDSGLDQDSSPVSDGSFMGRMLSGVNALGILGKLAQSMPDEMLEKIADNVLDVAEEIRAIRSGDYVANESIQDHSFTQAS